MTSRPRVWISLAAAATLLIAPGIVPARADDTPIAQIKTVAGTVSILRATGKVFAAAGDPVYEQDIIQTGFDGSIGITFTDNTVLSAGPNSEVSLAEYRFDSSDFKGEMLTDVRHGTVSMVSGDIARSSPSAMKVKTPTTILGVRGTHFVVDVDH